MAMKKFLFFIVLTMGLPAITYGQEPKFVYCQIIAYGRTLSNKVTVELDFGQKMQFFANNRLKDENGKVIKFNTKMDAMNYMSRQGWEFVQTYVVHIGNDTDQSSSVVYTILRKPFAELDDEAKKEYLKN